MAVQFLLAGFILLCGTTFIGVAVWSSGAFLPDSAAVAAPA